MVITSNISLSLSLSLRENVSLCKMEDHKVVDYDIDGKEAKVKKGR